MTVVNIVLAKND